MPASKAGCLHRTTRRASVLCWQRTSSATSPRSTRPAAMLQRMWTRSATNLSGPRRSIPCTLTATAAATAWTPAEGQQFYAAALAIEKEAWVAVAHETHRGRITYNPWSTRDLLLRLPRPQAQLRSQPLGVRVRAAADLGRGHHRAGRRALPPPARPRRLRKRAAGARSPGAGVRARTSPRTKPGGI